MGLDVFFEVTNHSLKRKKKSEYYLRKAYFVVPWVEKEILKGDSYEDTEDVRIPKNKIRKLAAKCRKVLRAQGKPNFSEVCSKELPCERERDFDKDYLDKVDSCLYEMEKLQKYLDSHKGNRMTINFWAWW